LHVTSVEIRINDVLGAAPGIAAVLLFGSAVRGRLRPDSDIDVATLFEHAPFPASKSVWRCVNALKKPYNAMSISLCSMRRRPFWHFRRSVMAD
jgi:predicted nucleotidyltransferase